jgi:hypothetical protein
MRVLPLTLFAALAAIVGALIALDGNAAPIPQQRLAQGGAVAVDTEVVLAVDVSYSMDPDEQHLQREGYVQALTSREFMDAVKAGTNGRISRRASSWMPSRQAPMDASRSRISNGPMWATKKSWCRGG